MLCIPHILGQTLSDTPGHALDLQVNDTLVIAPTDFYPEQAEKRTIISIGNVEGGSGVRLELDAPLKYNHNGEAYNVQHGGNNKTYNLDARAEVAVLSR